LLLAVKDGLKQAAGGDVGALYADQVTYATLPVLADQGRYTREAACDAFAANDPGYSQCLSRGVVVVDTHRSERLYSIANGRKFTYDSGRIDLAGRGFLGFRSITVHDPLIRTRSTDFYDQTATLVPRPVVLEPAQMRNPDVAYLPEDPTRGRVYLKLGRPVRSERVQGTFLRAVPSAASGPVSATCETTDYEINTAFQAFGVLSTRFRRSESIYFEHRNLPAAEASYAGLCQQDPAQALSRKTVLAEDFDEYNNARKVSAETAGGVRQVTARTYNNHTALGTSTKWILGQVASETVTWTKPQAATVKRKTVYDWRPESGKLWKVHVRSGQQPDAKPGTPVWNDDPSLDDIFKTTEYVYLPDGRLEKVIESGADKSLGAPSVRSLRMAYTYPPGNPDPVYPSHYYNALGHETAVKTHLGFGLPLTITDPAGHWKSFTYDGLGRLRSRAEEGKETVNVRLEQRSPSCGSCGLTSVEESSTGMKREMLIDVLGRTRTKSELGLNGTFIDVHYGFDEQGRLRTVSLPHERSTPSLRADRIIGYDDLDRVSRITNPDGSQRDLSYHRFEVTVESEVVPGDQKRGKVTYGYDADGFLVGTNELLMSRLVTGERYVGTSLWRDAAGQVNEAVISGFPAAMSNQRRIFFGYDELGRRTSIQDEALGDTELRYNAFGEVRWKKEGTGPHQRFFHDAAGRRTRRHSVNAAGTVTEAEEFPWDQETPSVPDGMTATNVSKDLVQHYYGFGANSQLANYWAAFPGDSAQPGLGIDFEYDFAKGGLLSITRYPEGGSGVNMRRVVTRREYANGHLARIRLGESATSTPVWSLLRATPVLVEEQTGDSVIRKREYEAKTGRLSRLTIGTIERYDYLYHPNGNLKSRTALNGDSDEMLYDTLGRLEVLTHRSGTSAYRREYTYDDFGSLTNVKTYDRATGGTLIEDQVYTLGWQDPVSLRVNRFAVTKMTKGGSTRSYKYDENGRRKEMISGHQRRYFYNHWGLPFEQWASSAVAARFLYGADGARAKKQTPTDTTYYLGDFYEDRRQGSASSKVNHIIVDGRVVADVIDRFETATSAPTRTIVYPQHDALGSIVARTGAESGRAYYEAFGLPVAADGRTAATYPGTSAMRDGFTGHEHDALIGESLINMKGRLYDPELRRFITTDPLVSDAARTQGWNPYSYVHNNPFRYNDPTGFAKDGDPDAWGGTIPKGACGSDGKCVWITTDEPTGTPTPTGQSASSGNGPQDAAASPAASFLGGGSGTGVATAGSAFGTSNAAGAVSSAQLSTSTARGNDASASNLAEHKSRTPGAGGPNPNLFEIWTRPADLGGDAQKYADWGWNNLHYGHQWVRYPAGNVEAGMGPAPNGGGWGQPTMMRDHTGAHNAKDAVLVDSVIVRDPGAVLQTLKLGTGTGDWYVVMNDCHDAAFDALAAGGAEVVADPLSGFVIGFGSP
jgi:RHS repeat-associated protein